MPVPGPRNQFAPEPGYRNPGREQPDRINSWLWPVSIAWPGRSPGTMEADLRGNVLGFGQVRHLWRQSVNEFFAQHSYSWSQNAPQPGYGFTTPRGFQITRALRYMARSLYMGGGIDNSRYAGLHTVVPKFNRGKMVTVGAGQKRSAPTVRNRMTSFGSRVTPLNQQSGAAE